MVRNILQVCSWLAACMWLVYCPSVAGESAGVAVRLEHSDSSATIAVETVERHKIQLTVEPKTAQAPLSLCVDLPITGPGAWPVADVEVRDSRGQPMAVRRSGIEWHRLVIPVPAKRDSYFVQAVEASSKPVTVPSEAERYLHDPGTGLKVAIARWFNGRCAALSIRFDDSHPSHLSTAIPILSEYGFRGTFMINPGKPGPGSQRGSDFEEHRAEWEACAKRGDQEFANHTARHRGASDDAAMEAEIGEAAEEIWRLFPGRSRLAALNLGGGTTWITTRPLRYYLDKYHLFDASQNSMGMDDIYGNRVTAFRNSLEKHVERGLWCRIHYHSIGEGLSSSEANFRAVLDIAEEHEDAIWIAGMADIYKYQMERNAAAISPLESDSQHFSFELSCLTDPELYDHPLMLEVTLPFSWPPERTQIRNAQGEVCDFQTIQFENHNLLRFEVVPRTEAYTVKAAP